MRPSRCRSGSRSRRNATRSGPARSRRGDPRRRRGTGRRPSQHRSPRAAPLRSLAEVAMAFKGWKVEALEFFEELAFENTKTWWLAHKAFYDEQVRGPMESLLAELQPTWGDAKIFRPYRDVRFTADKTPYKTHIG